MGLHLEVGTGTGTYRARADWQACSADSEVYNTIPVYILEERQIPPIDDISGAEREYAGTRGKAM